MSLPGGYVRWAHARGVNPWHPERWAPADHAALEAWRREQLGDPDPPPMPTRPYALCPCHGFTLPGPERDRPPEERISAAGVALWVDRDPFTRAGLRPRVAACLAWLARDFGRGQ